MNSCLFCKIVAGTIPCDEVFSDENFLAFRDIAPQAPTHILLIPRTHLTGLADLQDNHAGLIGEMMVRGSKIAAQEHLAAGGYRFVINCGADGGQMVDHLHLHILGGRKLAWPPG